MVKFIQKGLWRCFFMGKHKKWTLEDKVKIVKEFKKGATISYLNNKYGISGCTVVGGIKNMIKAGLAQIIEEKENLNK